MAGRCTRPHAAVRLLELVSLFASKGTRAGWLVEGEIATAWLRAFERLQLHNGRSRWVGGGRKGEREEK